ncbi:MAG: endolytic transglycosylase MltG [Lachnospiraceae bacterium]|nr:endolytic transglycosylase MltG [Lachnospiraceae bacterium]
MNSKEIVLSVFSTAFKLILTVVVIMLIYKGSITAYEYGNRIFTETPVSEGDGVVIPVAIEFGDNAYSIGQKLENKGLIRDAKLFYLQELLSEHRGEEQPGTYALSTSMTANEMITILAGESLPEKEQNSMPKIQSTVIGSEPTEPQTTEVGSEPVPSQSTTVGAESKGSEITIIGSQSGGN